MPLESSSTSLVCRACESERDADARFCANCGAPQGHEEDALIGQVVGDRYLVEEKIGEGRAGVVYRVQHVTLKRTLALKILHRHLSDDELAIERFRREATSVGGLDNPHIVTISDFGRMDDRLFMVMEHLSGLTLRELIEQRGQLEIDEAVQILRQLGEALLEAHAIGFVHRDLRPGNVFLTERRDVRHFVKLLDFGLAKLVEAEGTAASTSLGMKFGDVHYMSPEQAKGAPTDRRSDIYSLGCVGFHMLAGHPPHEGDTALAILKQRTSGVIPRLVDARADAPPWLCRAIECAMAPDPEDRYVTVYRLLQALDEGRDTGEIMSDERARRPPTTPPPSVSQALAKLGQRAESEEPATIPEEQEDAAPAGPMDSESGISSLWYADGDEKLSSEEEQKLAQARSTLGPTAAVSPEGTDDYYEPPRSNHKVIVLVTLGVLLLVFGGLALAFWGEESVSPKEEELAEAGEPAPPVVEVDRPAPSVTPPPDEPVPVQDAPEPTKPVPAEEKVPEPAASTGTPKEPAKEARTKPPVPPRDEKSTGTSTEMDSPAKRATPTVTPTPEPKETASPEDQKRAEFFTSLSLHALRNGNLTEAGARLEQAKKLHPASRRVWVAEAELAMAHGNHRRAARLLSRAVKKRASARELTLLGEAYLATGARKKAAENFKRALKINADNSRARNGYLNATGNQ